MLSNYKMLLDIDVGPFLDHFLTIVCCAREAKNIVKYNVFVLFACRNYILQHGKNCVITNVFFARHWHTNTVDTVIFATRCEKKNIVNTVVLGVKTSVFTVFFAPRILNKKVKTPPRD